MMWPKFWQKRAWPSDRRVSNVFKNALSDKGGAPSLTGVAKAAQRSKESGYDRTMHSTKPTPGPVQQDGNQNMMPPKATNAKPQTRSASPDAYNTSGMERAMAAHADQVHPIKRK